MQLVEPDWETVQVKKRVDILGDVSTSGSQICNSRAASGSSSGFLSHSFHPWSYGGLIGDLLTQELVPVGHCIVKSGISLLIDRMGGWGGLFHSCCKISYKDACMHVHTLISTARAAARFQWRCEATDSPRVPAFTHRRKMCRFWQHFILYLPFNFFIIVCVKFQTRKIFSLAPPVLNIHSCLILCQLWLTVMFGSQHGAWSFFPPKLLLQIFLHVTDFLLLTDH